MTDLLFVAAKWLELTALVLALIAVCWAIGQVLDWLSDPDGKRADARRRNHVSRRIRS